MTDYKMSAEAGDYQIAGSPIGGRAEYGAEGWQCFAFVFAAIVTLVFALLDEALDTGSVRAASKIVVFAAIGYFTLYSTTMKRFLVDLLPAIKTKEQLQSASMVAGSSPQWRPVFGFLEWYASHSISDLFPWFVKREGFYVSVRAVVFVLFGLLVFTWPNAATKTIILITVILLAVGLLVSTSHVFGVAGPWTNNLRFVLLNLGSFLSLTPAFAVLLAPLTDRFSPPLTWSRAIEVAFVATTGSNALAPAVSHYHWSSIVIGTSTVLALYYIVVILVVAVGQAQNHRSTDATR